LLLFCFGSIGGLQGAILSVPQDYATIQSAINAANYGDIVDVSPGNYFENLIVSKSGIGLRGAGQQQSIVDGSRNKAPALHINNSVDVTVTGFTLTRGRNGGIYIDNASPTIEDNEITLNTRETAGGGILVTGASANPLIRGNYIGLNGHYQGVGHWGGYGGGVYYGGGDRGVIAENTITSNNAWARGGAIYISASSPFIYGNVVSGNSADFAGGINVSDGSPILRNNLIINNLYDYLPSDSAGITVQFGSPEIINNTIVGNRNSGIHITNSDAPVDVRNNIIVANRLYGVSAYDQATLPFNDVYGNGQGSGGSDYAGPYGLPGLGAITLDPLFVNPSAGDYHLLANSPAIDAGDPNPQFADADGSRNDMGAYGGPLFTFEPFVVGDYNRDRVVDAADYVVWRRMLGQMVPAQSSADGNNNGIVDSGDFDIWRSHFGETMVHVVSGPASSNSVPEPPAGMLLALGVLSIVSPLRHRPRSDRNVLTALSINRRLSPHCRVPPTRASAVMPRIAGSA
jgi:hypothetical protein